jgi:uncharacterized protein
LINWWFFKVSEKVKRAFLSVLICASLAAAAPAFAQTLNELPFAKKLKLAKVGDEDAQMAVATAYELGNEAKLDVAEAAKWYRKAALLGNVEAEFRLARLVSKGAKGLTADLPTSAKLYELAAKGGHIESQNAIGQAYQNGLGVTPDNAKAAEWYRKAADAKLAAAENNLGILYLNGKGVNRDLAEAFKLFERAANQGDGWGLNNLGGMYEMGWGVPKDPKKAADYYKQALDKGITSAQTNLARVQVSQK